MDGSTAFVETHRIQSQGRSTTEILLFLFLDKFLVNGANENALDTKLTIELFVH